LCGDKTAYKLYPFKIAAGLLSRLLNGYLIVECNREQSVVCAENKPVVQAGKQNGSRILFHNVKQGNMKGIFGKMTVSGFEQIAALQQMVRLYFMADVNDSGVTVMP